MAPPAKLPPEPAQFYPALREAARLFARVKDIAAFFSCTEPTFRKWRDADPMIDILISATRAERLAPIDRRMEIEARAGNVPAAKVIYARLGQPLERGAEVDVSDAEELTADDFAQAIHELLHNRDFEHMPPETIEHQKDPPD